MENIKPKQIYLGRCKKGGKTNGGQKLYDG